MAASFFILGPSFCTIGVNGTEQYYKEHQKGQLDKMNNQFSEEKDHVEKYPQLCLARSQISFKEFLVQKE